MNDKKQYTLEELVDNSEFISWVKQGQIESSWWSAYGQDNETQLSIKQQAIDLIEMLQFSEDEASIRGHKDKVWAGIQKSTTAEPAPQTSRQSKIRPLYWIGAAAAACLLFLFMFKPGEAGNGIMHIQAHDNIVHHILPDQSSIEITPGSSISYNEQTWETKRDVSLKGEAFFNVEKGQSFTVKNEHASVVVLGTSFNVKQIDQSTEVICLSGKVSVISNESAEQEIITANESATVHRNDVRKQKHSKIYIPWKEEEYAYSKVSLKTIFTEIERSYNVDILVNDNDIDQAFTGSFEKSSLDNVLQNICWPMKLDYKIDGTQVTITSME